MILLGCTKNLYANCSKTLVGLRSKGPNLSYIKDGRRFILAPKLSKVFTVKLSLIVQGIIGLPGSNFFGAKLFFK